LGGQTVSAVILGSAARGDVDAGVEDVAESLALAARVGEVEALAGLTVVVHTVVRRLNADIVYGAVRPAR
jgi:hypothetical protein